MQPGILTRREFMMGGAGVALTGCSATTAEKERPAIIPVESPALATTYGPMPEEQFTLPAIPYQKISKRFHRQMVSDPTGERPGTLVVDTANYFMYLTCEDGQAMR